MGIVNLGLALLLAGPVGWGMYGVAAAAAIVLTVGNLIFGPWYAAHILGISHGTFFRGTLPIICTTLGLTAGCWAVAHYCHVHSWLGLAIGGGLVALVYIVFVFNVLLTRTERHAVRSVVFPSLESVS